MSASSDFYRYEHVYEDQNSKATKMKLYTTLPEEDEGKNRYLDASNFNPTKKKYRIVDLSQTTMYAAKWHQSSQQSMEKAKLIQSSDT